MKISEYRKKLTSEFQLSGFDSPELEASFILEEVLQLRHTELILYAENEVTPEQYAKAEEFKKRRLQNEPYQYIFGWTPFRDLNLKVGPGVLIPRPETEFMLDPVIKMLPFQAKVCELGTGSGAISLALGSERKDISVWGSEFSPQAFYWSELNRKESGLKNVQFLQGDLYDAFPAELRFDAVIANLPYIDEAERTELPPNVRDYEPASALFAPDHGYALMERAIREAPMHLNEKHSYLIFEIGETQGERLLQYIQSCGYFDQAEVRPDQYGVPRWLFAEHSAWRQKLKKDRA